jgi:hypothetical protein
MKRSDVGFAIFIFLKILLIKQKTISCRSTFPSFVIFKSPEPETSLIQGDDNDNGFQVNFYIFRVPLGPKFVFITSCKPLAPLIFISRAAAWRASSAFGFKQEIEAIIKVIFFLA